MNLIGKRVAAVMITVMIVALAIPANVNATIPKLELDGTDLIASPQSIQGASYESSTRTLTLDNYATGGVLNVMDMDLNIILYGDNALIQIRAYSNNDTSNLTIRGSGKLTVTNAISKDAVEDVVELNSYNLEVTSGILEVYNTADGSALAVGAADLTVSGNGRIYAEGGMKGIDLLTMNTYWVNAYNNGTIEGVARDTAGGGIYSVDTLKFRVDHKGQIKGTGKIGTEEGLKAYGGISSGDWGISIVSDIELASGTMIKEKDLKIIELPKTWLPTSTIGKNNAPAQTVTIVAGDDSPEIKPDPSPKPVSPQTGDGFPVEIFVITSLLVLCFGIIIRKA